MQSSNHKLMYAFAGALSGLLCINLFTPYFYQVYTPDYYLGLHTLLEFISILIAYVVCSTVWLLRNGLDDQPGRFLITLGLSFFTVGSVDLFHTLSYQGMPDLVTPSSAEKAIFLWLVGRFSVAISFLAAITMLYSQCTRSIRSIAHAILAISVCISLGALIFSTKFLYLLPPLFVEGTGLTPLKRYLEYIVMALYLLGFFLLLQHRHLFKERVFRYLGYFLIMTICSEAVFTFYKSVYDIYNLIGHLYKAAAYYFLFVAISLSGISNHFYTLGEMAKMSAELLKEDISLDPVIEIQMTKLRTLIPQAERIIFYVQDDAEHFRANYVWGKFSDLLPKSSQIHFPRISTLLGSNIRIIDHPIKVLNQLSPGEYTPEIAVIWREAHQALHVPLVAEQKYYGFIMLFVFNPLRRFGQADIEKATVFQQFSSLAIARVKQHEVIYRLSYEDSLTGLPNRRFFFEKISEIKFDAARYDIPFTVVFLDMNGLKYINDTFGHSAGDTALQLIGEQLKAIRKTDVAARLGGDEFGIIFKHMNFAEGQQKIAELQKHFASLPMPEYGVTFSLAVGGASFPAESTSEEVLIKMADDRMYMHKRQIKQMQGEPHAEPISFAG